MGVENNECIIATTNYDEAILKIKDWIKTLDEDQQPLFAFLPSIVNNKTTLFLAPDGSKKGWDEAERGDILRDKLIDILKTFNFDWVEVGYGEYGQTVLRGNCVNRFNGREYATEG